MRYAMPPTAEGEAVTAANTHTRAARARFGFHNLQFYFQLKIYG